MKTIGMTGKHHSEETKIKMRAKALGRSHSEQAKRLISEDNKLRWHDGRMNLEKIKPFLEAGSNATRGKPNPHTTADKNHFWKGDMASYSAIHHWVKYHWGKADHCDRCSRTEYPKYEWHNLNKQYKRIREDWIQVCIPCHRLISGAKEIK